MKNLEEIKSDLIKKGIFFEVINFSNEAIAARNTDNSLEHNYNPNNAIKTLIIECKQGYKAIVLKGNDSINKEELKKLIGKWSIISTDKLETIFGFRAGSVCPLVLDIPMLVDTRAFDLTIWSVGAGENNKGLNVTIDQVQKYLKFDIVRISLSMQNNATMTTEEKIKLITRNCQEVLTVDDLRELIENKTPLRHYIGFEISGLVHLGTGYVSMGKVADFLKAGVKCQIFLADFHTYLNNKLGGNLDDIRWAAENYFKQALIASLECHQVDVEAETKAGNLTFINGFDLYNNNIKHWETFMEVGKHVTLSRNLRSISIMGKKQGNDVDMATLFYPPLQVADIFSMSVNLAHAGMDQRKAHVVCRQVAKSLSINPLLNSEGEKIAPVAIHQNLIAGLTGPEKVDMAQTEEDKAIDLKMSKSKPNSAIFVHDSPEEIKDKIRKAYGPPKEVAYNPLLNWVKMLVFWGEETGEFEVKRPEKFGGNKKYEQYLEVENDYAAGELFPLDLKNSLADWLIQKLAPARNYFDQPEQKAALEKMCLLLAKK